MGENFWGCLSTCTTPNSSRVLVGVVKWYEKTGIYGINSLYYSRYQTINNNYSKEYQTKSDALIKKNFGSNIIFQNYINYGRNYISAVFPWIILKLYKNYIEIIQELDRN